MPSLARVALPLLLLAVAARPAAAQLRLGGHAGWVSAEISDDDLGSFAGARSGFTGGVFAEWTPPRAPVGLRLGAQYAQKGMEIDLPLGELDGEEFAFGIHVDYVEIPLLATLAFTRGGPLGARVFAGPALGVRAQCSYHGTFENIDVSFDCDDPELQAEIGDAPIDRLDFAFLGGGGLTLDLGGAQLLADVSYWLGLTPVFEGGPGTSDSGMNRAMSLTAGASFPVGD